MHDPIGTVMVCPDGCCVAQLNDDRQWQTMDAEQPGRSWQYDREDLYGDWTVVYTPQIDVHQHG